MSEQDNKAQSQQQPNKGREPSHDIYQVTGQGKSSQWHKIGAAWSGKDDSISGDTVHGRLVLKSRAALKEIREEKQNKQDPSQGQSPSKEPSQTPSM